MSNTVGYSLGCVTPVRYNLTQGEDATGNAVAFSLPSCVPPPIGDESVTLSTVSQSSVPVLIGYSEFVSPSTPPKKYLNNAGFGDYDYFVVPTSQCGNCSAVVERASVYWGGTASYHPLTGVGTPVQYLLGRSYSPSCDPVPMSPGGYSMLTSAPDPNIFQPDVVTPTFRSYKIYSACHEYYPGNSVMCDNRGLHQTLSVEDTEVNAIVRAVPTPGTSAVALRTARTTGFSFDLTTVEATLHCSNLDASLRYRVSYDVKETNLTTAETTLTPNAVDVPAFSTSYDLDAVTLSPPSGFSLEVVNYNIFTR